MAAFDRLVLLIAFIAGAATALQVSHVETLDNEIHSNNGLVRLPRGKLLK